MPNRNAYETYKVVRGDTLAAIAKRFGSSVAAIARASGVADVNRIEVGQDLLIPVAAGARPAPVNSAPKSVPGETGQSVQTSPGPDVWRDMLAYYMEPPRVYIVAGLALAAFLVFTDDGQRQLRKIGL